MRHLAAVLLFVCLPVRGDPNAVLAGLVITRSGAALRNTRVALVTATGQVRRETRTDDLGIFAFSLLPAGSYYVQASVSGKPPRRAGPVVLKAGEKRAWRIVWDTRRPR